MRDYDYLVLSVSGSSTSKDKQDTGEDLNAGLSCRETMRTHTGYPERTAYAGKKTNYVKARCED